VTESKDSDLPTTDTAYGGKGIDDFHQRGILASVKKGISLLDAGKRRLLIFAAILQVSLGLLDLLGIALIGLVAAVAVSGVGVTQIPAPAEDLLSTLRMGNLTVSQISIILALSAVTILILKTGLSALMARKIMFFLANRQAELSVKLARNFLSRPLAVIQKWTTSEATYALGGGASAATVSLLGPGIVIASEVFLFLIVGVSLLLFDPILTIAAFSLFLSIVLILQRVLGRWSARNAQIMTDASIANLTIVSEALSTYRESTVLNRRDLYVAKFETNALTSARTSALSAYIMEIPKYVLEAALYFGILVLAVVQFLTKDWGAAAATTALFLAAGSRIIPALLRLQGAGIAIRNSSIQAQPTFFMYDYLTALPNNEISSTARITAEEIHRSIESGYPGFSADIVMENVGIRYESSADPAVTDISFSCSAGNSVALVGSTGAGKSTLADLILSVLDPDRGRVLVGGVSPREAIHHWPGAISYVPQNVALTIGSVRENVAMGLPRDLIDDQLVWDALRRAHLADFLTEFREGIDTNVGERGFRLSGGQRQRLGIARALYTRPKLLVLDEATSALDSETEQAIIEMLNELESEVTTVTVAHRLATVRRADLLIYLKDGHSIAQGTFEEVRALAPDFDRQAALLGL
jgi:ABC-type multidrug transport system fused ATPase/permease subunit